MSEAYLPSRERVAATLAAYPDGISAQRLVALLIEQGFERPYAQRRLQSMLDSGAILLGKHLWLYPGPTRVKKVAKPTGLAVDPQQVVDRLYEKFQDDMKKLD